MQIGLPVPTALNHSGGRHSPTRRVSVDSPAPRPPKEARSPSADDSVLIERAGRGGDVEQLPPPHPALRPIEHVPGVGLGDDALPRPEAEDIDQRQQVWRYLPGPVVAVAGQLEVDLLLRVKERPEVPLDVLTVRLRRQQK